MDDDQQFCLRWNNHQSTLISVFDTLLENGTLVDCTLAAEGKFLKAHKVVLSACSPYFATLLSQQYDKHPIFILKDVKFQELRAMMDYMYRGEVNISQDQLAALLKAAESLQIKGLSDSRGGASSAVSGSAGICASQKSDHKALSVPVTSGPIKSNSPSGGYTIEQKRPRHAVGASSSIESQAGSREGSSSPTSRKRKRIRRRSMDNLTIDNHEHSNSSSQSMQINSSVAPSNTSTAMGSVPSSVAVSQAIVTQQTGAVAGTSGIVTAGTNTGLNVTKKTDSVSSNAKLEGAEQEVDNDNGDEEDESGKLANMRKEQNKRKQHTSDVDQKDSGGEILIEPKSEYDDGNDETVEDLTLDDEELLEDLEQAGPSHGGGEGSSQGYAQWQVERSQDDVFMATQESAGQQRDPQEYFLECGDDLEEAMVYQIVTEESEYGCNEDDTDVGLLIDGTFRQSEHEHEEVDNFVYSMKEVANSKDIQMPIQFKRYSNTHSHTSKISNLNTVIGSHKINVHSPIVELRNEVVVKKVKKLANLLAVTNLKANNRAYKKIKSIRRSRQNPH
ncbi:longitudinals lacking protein, isoforms H/M/V isoform X8 [Hermetia illucens]|uniref:longitudinals lacking protein, isoforms H/M/V isoform X8 n=1 Tax=Hermetia illucens TaxID=343691 RepID=UPI0018CC6679|nr:longitudinals lacking protein, isoforms H/M/V isoform X8 [Hermetia illucens]